MIGWLGSYAFICVLGDLGFYFGYLVSGRLGSYSVIGFVVGYWVRIG